MANSLGKLEAILGLNASGFKSELASAGKDLDGFSGRAEKGASLVGKAMAGIGVAAAGGLLASIKVAADFEHEMSAVGAVSGATADEMKGLSDTALRIGKDTSFSASEAASAMEELAAQGVSAKDIMGGAADAVVALAAAGGTDLVTSATAASTAMNIWHLSTDKLTDVVNRLTGAANTSAFGVEDMVAGMQNGGIAAATFGISMEDTTTSLAALSKGGFQSGAEAGTAFKVMLQSLAAPAGTGADEIAALGINVRDASGQMKPMAGVIDELHDKLDGLSKEDRDAAMVKIFGTHGMMAAAALMAQTGQSFTDMSNVMKNTDAAAIAKQRMDNFNGALENLKGTIETIMIQLGTKFLPVLTEVALWLSENLPPAVDAVGAAFDEWGPKVMAIAQTIIGALAPAIQAIVPYVQQFIDVISNNQPAMEALGIVLGVVIAGAFVALLAAIVAIAAPVAVAIASFVALSAAVGAVVAVVVLVIQHWDEIVAKFPVAGEALQGVQDIWAGVVAWVKGTFIPTFSGLADAVMNAGKLAVGFVRDHWSQIQSIIEAAVKLISTQIEAWVKFLGTVIEGGMKVIEGIINVAMGLLSGDWGRAWDGIKQIVDGVWTLIKGVVQLGIDTAKNVLTNGVDLIKAAWGLAWDVIWNKVQEIWNSITGKVGDAIGAVHDAVSGGLDRVKSSWSDAWDAVETALREAWDRIQNAVAVAIATLEATFTSLPGQILTWLGDLGSTLYDAGVKLVQGFIDGIGSMFGAVGDKLGDLTDKLTDWKGPPERDETILYPAGQMVIRGFINGLESEYGTVKDSLGSVTGIAARSAEDWIKAFGDAPREAATAFNALDDATRFGLAENTGLVAAWAKTGIAMYEDYTFALDGIKDAYTGTSASVNDATKILTDGTAMTIDDWMWNLQDGLTQGTSMSVDLITQMFADLNYLTTHSGLDAATQQAMEAQRAALMNGFRETGSLSNQAMLDMFTNLKDVAKQGVADVTTTLATGLTINPVPLEGIQAGNPASFNSAFTGASSWSGMGGGEAPAGSDWASIIASGTQKYFGAAAEVFWNSLTDTQKLARGLGVPDYVTLPQNRGMQLPDGTVIDLYGNVISKGNVSATSGALQAVAGAQGGGQAVTNNITVNVAGDADEDTIKRVFASELDKQLGYGATQAGVA